MDKELYFSYILARAMWRVINLKIPWHVLVTEAKNTGFKSLIFSIRGYGESGLAQAGWSVYYTSHVYQLRGALL
jgi:hypothetical protein